MKILQPNFEVTLQLAGRRQKFLIPIIQVRIVAIRTFQIIFLYEVFYVTSINFYGYIVRSDRVIAR